MASGAPPGESDRGAPSMTSIRSTIQVAGILAVERGWNQVLRGAEAITLPLAYGDFAADLPRRRFGAYALTSR